MRSIVTGGAGFIGSHLCEQLIKLGHKVFVIDNFSNGKIKNLSKIKNKITIIKQDIRNYKKIQKKFKNIDNVFHLAALSDIVPSIEKPDEYFTTNVDGTFNVLKASHQNKIKRFIYCASGSCYGIPKKIPTSEKSEISPEYPYSLTKRLGEEIVLHFAKIYKLNATSLRLFNVYGPRSRTSGAYGAVFGVFLAQKLSNKPFTVVGDGTQTRDFTFVSDVVDAMISAAKSKINNEVINIGSSKTYSVNQLAELLKGDTIYIPKRPGEPDCTWADISKAKKLLKWKPKISLEEGINIVLKNIDYWKEAPVWDKKSISKATKKWFKYLS